MQERTLGIRRNHNVFGNARGLKRTPPINHKIKVIETYNVNLPHNGSWHGIFHVIVADVTHFASKEVIDLDGTVTLRSRNVFVVVVETYAVGGHIHGAKRDLRLDSKF